MLYAMTTSVLPFNADKSHDNNISLIKKVTKGLGTDEHKKEMKNMSVQARSLIKKCLDVNPLTRITAEQILKERWIYEEK